VLFISPHFTPYQRESINFKDLPIELWEIKKYSNQTVSYQKIQNKTATESIKTVSKTDSSIEEVSKEIMVFTEDEHTKGKPDSVIELYNRIKERILNLDNVEVKPKKIYIGFISKTNFVDIHLQKNGIKLWLNLQKGQLNDPEKMARDVSSIGHWGNGQYEIAIKEDHDIDYLFSLIKQSYLQNKE
jgi:predicted transport protein